jgi:hypothetical protein
LPRKPQRKAHAAENDRGIAPPADARIGRRLSPNLRAMEVDMATKRTTMYSTGGKKLYAVRAADGTFKDIQTYKRAHTADMARKSKPEKAAALKKAAKKKPAKKAARKAAVKKVAKKAVKKSAKKSAAKKAARRK